MTTLAVSPYEIVRSVRPRNYREVEALYDWKPGTLREARNELLNNEWGEGARDGDWRDLLCINRVRVLLIDKLWSDRLPSPEDRNHACEGVALPVWKEAREYLRARKRQGDMRVKGQNARERTPGRIFGLWIAKLKARAVAEGVTYHREVQKLYVSKRADVVYGKGGQAGRDDEAYSKGYRSKFGGAKWLNAGARLDDERHPTCIIIENYRGTEVARVSLRKED